MVTKIEKEQIILQRAEEWAPMTSKASANYPPSELQQLHCKKIQKLLRQISTGISSFNQVTISSPTTHLNDLHFISLKQYRRRISYKYQSRKINIFCFLLNILHRSHKRGKKENQKFFFRP